MTPAVPVIKKVRMCANLQKSVSMTQYSGSAFPNTLVTASVFIITTIVIKMFVKFSLERNTNI